VLPCQQLVLYVLRLCAGDTPLLYIAREGHYKYPPAEIPALLIQSGANMEAKDSAGRTALQVGHMG
jgi:ankyrin repeat protein